MAVFTASEAGGPVSSPGITVEEEVDVSKFGYLKATEQLSIEFLNMCSVASNDLESLLIFSDTVGLEKIIASSEGFTSHSHYSTRPYAPNIRLNLQLISKSSNQALL